MGKSLKEKRQTLQSKWRPLLIDIRPPTDPEWALAQQHCLKSEEEDTCTDICTCKRPDGEDIDRKKECLAQLFENQVRALNKT